MRNVNFPFFVGLFFAIGGSFTNTGQADVIHYGNLADVNGSTVFFNNVREESTSIPSPFPSLYGTPDVWMANMLATGIQLFEARQLNISGSQTVEGTLRLSLVAHPGFVITGVIFDEMGEFAVSNGAGSVSVTGSGSLTSPSISLTNSDNRSASTGIGIPYSLWGMSIPIQFSPTDYSSTADVVFTNTLFASASAANVNSYINKTNFKLTVLTLPIPEPHAGGIVLTIGAMVCARFRRR
jgi:hypothetical protein